MSRMCVMLIVLALLTAACGSSGDETTPAMTTTTTAARTTTAAPTTSAAPSTTTTSPVEAEAPPAILVTFDGETCAYQGSSEASPTEILSVELDNTADVTVYVNVLEYSEADTETLRAAIGQSFGDEDEPDIGGPTGIAAELRADPGATSTQDTLLVPGSWFVICKADERLWPAGVIEST